MALYIAHLVTIALFFKFTYLQEGYTLPVEGQGLGAISQVHCMFVHFLYIYDVVYTLFLHNGNSIL